MGDDFYDDEIWDDELRIGAVQSIADLPAELRPQPLTFDMIREAQAADPECIGIRLRMAAKDKRDEGRARTARRQRTRLKGLNHGGMIL